MGFLRGLFGGSGGGADDVVVDTGEAPTCPSCGAEIGYENEGTEHGTCEECPGTQHSAGALFCCGAIYEEGEDTCASCGEPL